MAEESNAIEELKIKDDLSDANTLTIENEEPNQTNNKNEDDKYKDILEVKEDLTKSKKKILILLFYQNSKLNSYFFNKNICG